MSAGRAPFPPVVLLPVVVAGLVSTAVPGAPVWAPALLLLVVLARRGILRRAPEWSGGEGWLAAWVLAPVALAAWIGGALHQGMPASAAIGTAVTLLTAVSVCAPPTGVALVRLVGLSAASVALAAALVPTGPVFAGVTGYVIALALALLDLDRRRASPFPSGAQASLRHVRARSDAVRPGLRLGRQALRLASVAVPLAVWLFLTLPTKPDTSEDPARRDGGGPGSSRSSADDADGRGAGGGMPALDAFVSGARTRMRLDFVRRVQGDQLPVLLVRVGEGEDPGTSLLLRGMAYDRLAEDERGVSAWTRSPALTAQDRVVGPDASEAEWIWLGLDPPGRPPVRHVVRDLLGHDGGTLFLPPGPRRVRFDAELAEPRLRVSADGVVAGLGRLQAGRGYEVDAPGPGRARRPTAEARSDGATAPLSTYVSIPPDAVALRAIAKTIVAEATAPSERAERVEAWLRGLRYSKEMPRVDPRHPLVDFLTRVRAGHCEWFASSMAALLRSLGHPTRLVVGFRGGDFLATIGWVSFRGSHAHAWCEVWFEGLGWVPYDPTPADAREAPTGGEDPARTPSAGAGEPGDAASDEDGTPFVDRMLRFSREDRRRLADAAGRALERARRGLERTVDRWVPGAGPLAWPVALLLLLVLAGWLRVRRRRAAGLAPATSAAGAALRDGPYVRALAGLAGAGLRRKEAHTPGEHARRVGAALPSAGLPLATLTGLHVRARYGETPWTPEEHAAAESAADGVVRAARERV